MVSGKVDQNVQTVVGSISGDQLFAAESPLQDAMVAQERLWMSCKLQMAPMQLGVGLK